MPNRPMDRRRTLIRRLLFPLLLLVHLLILAPPLLAQSTLQYVDLVRYLDADELHVPTLGGITFIDAHQSFLLVAPTATDGQTVGQTTVTAVTAYADTLGALTLPLAVEPLTVAVDPNNRSLFFWAPASRELLRFALQDNGLPLAAPTARLPLSGVTGALQGLALAPDSQSLYLLTADNLLIQQVTLPSDNTAATILAAIDLRHYGLTQARGLALHPQRRHLFTLDPTTQMLYEIALDGALVAQYDLAPFQLHHPQGFVFAPSGDPTDEPGRLHLYFVDQIAAPAAVAPDPSQLRNLPGRLYLPLAMGGTATTAATQRDGRIAELTFDLPVEPAQAASVTNVGVLVQTVQTSLYQPPSPDPSDIAYIPTTPYLATSNRLLIADGEVDEMAIYAGANLFETTLSGALQRTYTTVPDLSREPVGLAFNPNNGHLFISDDNSNQPLIEIDPGADKLYRTNDDRSTKFSVRDAYGVIDPEGVEYARIGTTDWLFFADGLSNEVHLVRPGPNGKFDGLDDLVTHFDSAILGVTDPEGIAYHPVSGTLFLVGKPATRIAEITLTGALVRYLDITAAKAKKPAGLTFAPGSQNANQWHLYIVDRKVDNDSDPNENDGMLYEIALPTNNLIYLSPSAAGSVGSIAYRDEDLLAYNPATQQWKLVFDGSDVGLSLVDVDALALLADGSFLLSMDQALTLTGLGVVSDTDILRFTPTSLGNTTAGAFAFYLRGADMELTTVGEDIDAIDLLPDGRLLFSTAGTVNLLGIKGADEDLIALDLVRRSATLYFEGSLIGLTDSSEDIGGFWIDATSKLYLTTRGAFVVPGLQGTATDIFTCQAQTSGAPITSCTFSNYWQGASAGLGANPIDALAIGGNLPLLSSTAQSRNADQFWEPLPPDDEANEVREDDTLGETE